MNQLFLNKKLHRRSQVGGDGGGGASSFSSSSSSSSDWDNQNKEEKKEDDQKDKQPELSVNTTTTRTADLASSESSKSDLKPAPSPSSTVYMGQPTSSSQEDVTSFNQEKDLAYTICPILHVRGMDFFLTPHTTPIFDVCQDPWFQNNGLRDVPSFLCNMVTQWGNLLIYFQLPSWIKNLTDCLVEHEKDMDDVKALKVCIYLYRSILYVLDFGFLPPHSHYTLVFVFCCLFVCSCLFCSAF